MATTMTPEMVSAFSALRAAEGHLESMRSALYALGAEERGVARQALDAALDAYSLVVETRKAAFSASLAGLSEREENEILRALEEPALGDETPHNHDSSDECGPGCPARLLLVKALAEATSSLTWISKRRRLAEETWSEVALEIRGYATSRAGVARDALHGMAGEGGEMIARDKMEALAANWLERCRCVGCERCARELRALIGKKAEVRIPAADEE